MNRIRLPLAGLTVVILAVVALIVATSGGSASTAKPQVASNSAISIKQTSLGKTLVDANGRTLYLFVADQHNRSTLSAAGRAVWPPFTATIQPRALGGALASQVTTIKGNQIAYNGHPLYYFVADHHAGQTAGQGLNEFGAKWYVLSPTGTAVTSAAASTAPANTSSAYSY
jgi:predicted lipoprotein with Yx(FWY)xxD motif